MTITVKDRRKAVSPVIAVLLLILIAVAMAVMVYVWAIGYAGQIRPTTPETAERLKIETGKLFIWCYNVADTDLGFDAKDNPNRMDVNVTLVVKNVGGADVNITEAYLLSAGYEIINYTTCYGDQRKYTYVDHAQLADTLLEVGKTYKLSICFPDTEIQRGKTYIVKIVTSLGNEYLWQLKAGTYSTSS